MPVPNAASSRRARKPVRTHRQLETTGVIVIAIVILAITVLRYWHNIHWSTR